MMADIPKVSRLISSEISKVIVGMRDVTELMIVALLSNGHILVEGVPGVAKTLLAKAFSQTLNLSFRRIQFTPDMLPADVTGTFVFNQSTREFSFRRGPVFASVILADEVNRASPKTQSALLEAMQESQVTVEGQTEKLPEPFMVLATQNPVEQEGTYPLPEAQLDRFMFRIIVNYPDSDEGVRILKLALTNAELTAIKPVTKASEILSLRDRIRDHVHVSEEVLRYIVRVIEATRADRSKIILGGSPRAMVLMLNASRALAAMKGRDYVTPDDVKELVFPILNHRLILRPEYLVESGSLDNPLQYDHIRSVISESISNIEPPR